MVPISEAVYQIADLCLVMCLDIIQGFNLPNILKLKTTLKSKCTEVNKKDLVDSYCNPDRKLYHILLEQSLYKKSARISSCPTPPPV